MTVFKIVIGLVLAYLIIKLIQFIFVTIISFIAIRRKIKELNKEEEL